MAHYGTLMCFASLATLVSSCLRDAPTPAYYRSARAWSAARISARSIMHGPAGLTLVDYVVRRQTTMPVMPIRQLFACGQISFVDIRQKMLRSNLKGQRTNGSTTGDSWPNLRDVQLPALSSNGQCISGHRSNFRSVYTFQVKEGISTPADQREHGKIVHRQLHVVSKRQPSQFDFEYTPFRIEFFAYV
jgi:hypothetical protein